MYKTNELFYTNTRETSPVYCPPELDDYPFSSVPEETSYIDQKVGVESGRTKYSPHPKSEWDLLRRRVSFFLPRLK